MLRDYGALRRDILAEEAVGGGQAGQVEGEAPREGPSVRLGGRLEARLGEAGEDEAVDGVTAPGGFGGRSGLGLGRLEGPVGLVGRARRDPAAEGLDGGGHEALAEVSPRSLGRLREERRPQLCAALVQVQAQPVQQNNRFY